MFAGLNLVLYAQEDEYNDNFSDMNGFRILVHPFNTLALPEQNGFYVNAGTLTSASLRTVRNDVIILLLRHRQPIESAL
jgi:hypothetical protein